MRGTVGLKLKRRPEAHCAYDESGPDTYKNRILKTCARLLMRSPEVEAERQRSLKRCLLSMSEVGEVDPRHVEWGRLRYHRNNGPYRILMNVCYMVLNSLLLTTDEGTVKLATFSDSQELYQLYEKFVREHFRKEHPELKASAKYVDRKVGQDAPPFLPGLHTDVTLEIPGRTLIVDTKCYGQILGTNFGRSMYDPAHLNQIQSYVMHEAYGHPDTEVSGMLLYALTDDESALHDTWTELDHRFHVWTLDLGQPFSEIARQLDEVAALLLD